MDAYDDITLDERTYALRKSAGGRARPQKKGDSQAFPARKQGRLFVNSASSSTSKGKEASPEHSRKAKTGQE